LRVESPITFFATFSTIFPVFSATFLPITFGIKDNKVEDNLGKVLGEERRVEKLEGSLGEVLGEERRLEEEVEQNMEGVDLKRGCFIEADGVGEVVREVQGGLDVGIELEREVKDNKQGACLEEGSDLVEVEVEIEEKVPIEVEIEAVIKSVMEVERKVEGGVEEGIG
jgi:hypothetical protein